MTQRNADNINYYIPQTQLACDAHIINLDIMYRSAISQLLDYDNLSNEVHLDIESVDISESSED